MTLTLEEAIRRERLSDELAALQRTNSDLTPTSGRSAPLAAPRHTPTPPTVESAPIGRETIIQTPPKDDLSDLPPELLAELSERVKSETDPIIKIINDRGGTATLDEILIDLYRKHGELAKRTITNNKLNRLSRRSMVWSVPGKKGVYSTTGKRELFKRTTPTNADTSRDTT